MRLRRLTAAVVLMLVASMTASVWASCMGQIGMKPQAEMACCKNGHDKCPMHDTAADCCKLGGQQRQQVSFATHEATPSIVNPPAVVVARAAVALTPAAVRVSQSTVDRDVLKRLDPPPYLLGSAFLV